MSTTITNGTTVLQPLLWMEYRSTREANTIVHQLHGGGTAITVAPHAPREVAVALLFDDEAAAAACEAMHARPGVIQITEDGRPTHSMQYVVTGPVERVLDTETARAWIVSARVTEVGQ